MNRRIVGLIAAVALSLTAVLALRAMRSRSPAVSPAARSATGREARAPAPPLGASRPSKDAARVLEADRPQPSSQQREPGFDVSKVESVHGRIAAPGGPNRRVPALFMLETAKETVAVKLGPPRYLQSIGLELAPGDELDVTGARVTGPGRSIIIASTVTKAGRQFTLRDGSGQPSWGRRSEAAGEAKEGDGEAAP